MSDSFDTLVILREQIEAILEERDQLREALERIVQSAWRDEVELAYVVHSDHIDRARAALKEAAQ